MNAGSSLAGSKYQSSCCIFRSEVGGKHQPKMIVLRDWPHKTILFCVYDSFFFEDDLIVAVFYCYDQPITKSVHMSFFLKFRSSRWIILKYGKHSPSSISRFPALDFFRKKRKRLGLTMLKWVLFTLHRHDMAKFLFKSLRIGCTPPIDPLVGAE